MYNKTSKKMPSVNMQYRKVLEIQSQITWNSSGFNVLLSFTLRIRGGETKCPDFIKVIRPPHWSLDVRDHEPQMRSLLGLSVSLMMDEVPQCTPSEVTAGHGIQLVCSELLQPR